MRILKEEAVLLLVDLQEKLYPHIVEKEDLLRKTAILIQGIKALNIPRMVTEQYPKGLGKTIPQIGNLVKDVVPLEKISFSCMDDQDIRRHLKNLGKRFVILAGIEAHVCILQTAVDLSHQGYTPVIVTDCISSRNTCSKETALQRFSQEGIILSSAESVLFELLRYAGSEEFKTISRLVK